MSIFRKAGPWLAPEVYPVIVCIAGGLGLAAWFGMRQLSKHNDIVINKTHPRQYMARPYEKMMPNGYKTHMQPHHKVTSAILKS